MKTFVYAAVAAMAFTAQAQALTFKSGEVLGSDGQMHQGASPEQMERIVEKAKASGDVGGVTGNNVFVVVGENVTFIPVNDLKGLSKESQIAVVGDAVVQDLTGNPTSPMSRCRPSTKLPMKPASASRKSSMKATSPASIPRS